MNFGVPNHEQHVKYYDWDELYEEEDTYPQETDDYELWWSKRSLKKCLKEHGMHRGVI